MSESQTQPDTDDDAGKDLSTFQLNILAIIAEEARYGLAIKRELEDYYDIDVNHGRLYPNLDDLVERGHVEKSELDKRTNEYALTDAGYNTLLARFEWLSSKVATTEERTDDIRALLDD